MISGIVPPIPTPFNEDGELDLEAFENLVKMYVDAGVDGVAIGGSTGEGYALSDEELRMLIEVASRYKKGNLMLIAGVITDSVVQAVRRINAVKDLDAVDAYMVTPPHYLFNSGDEGHYEYYKLIHDKTKVPILVYNVIPWNVVNVHVLERLINDGVVVGVKQSGGDIHALAELLARVKNQASVITALDDLLLPSFILGAHGSIAAANSLFPHASVRLYRAVKEGDLKLALRIHEETLPIIRFIIQQPDMPARLKFVLRSIGWSAGYARKPILEPTGQLREELLKMAIKVAEIEKKYAP